MLKNLGKLFLTVCLITIGGGVVANAQIDDGLQIRTSIPFAFSVGTTTLPAGQYQISRNDDSLPTVLLLSTADGRTRVVVDTEDSQTRTGEPAAKTEIVFDKIGDQYFLSQIWLEGALGGNQVAKSKMERRLEEGGSPSEKHSIAAVLKRLKP